MLFNPLSSFIGENAFLKWRPGSLLLDRMVVGFIWRGGVSAVARIVLFASWFSRGFMDSRAEVFPYAFFRSLPLRVSLRMSQASVWRNRGHWPLNLMYFDPEFF